MADWTDKYPAYGSGGTATQPTPAAPHWTDRYPAYAPAGGYDPMPEEDQAANDWSPNFGYNAPWDAASPEQQVDAVDWNLPSTTEPQAAPPAGQGLYDDYMQQIGGDTARNLDVQGWGADSTLPDPQKTVTGGQAFYDANQPSYLDLSQPDTQNLIEDARQQQKRHDTKHPVQAWGKYLGDRSIPWVSTVSTIADDMVVLGAVKDMNAGRQLSDTQIQAMGKYLNENEASQKRGFLAGAGDVLAQLPAFAGELGVGRGAGVAARQTVRAAISAGLKKALSNATKKGILKSAASLARRGAGRAAELATRTALVPQLVAKKTLERQIQNPDESLTRSAVHGTFQAATEVVTELLGGKVLKSLLGKPLSVVAGKLASKTPALDPLRMAVASVWLKLKPGRDLADFGRRAATRMGWDGVLAEIGEERLNDLILGLAGTAGAAGSEYEDYGALGDLGAGATGDVTRGLKGLKQVAQEGVAFSAIPTGSAVASGTANALGGLKKPILTPGMAQTLVATNPQAASKLVAKLETGEPLTRGDFIDAGLPQNTGAKQRAKFVEQIKAALEAPAAAVPAQADFEQLASESQTPVALPEEEGSVTPTEGMVINDENTVDEAADSGVDSTTSDPELSAPDKPAPDELQTALSDLLASEFPADDESASSIQSSPPIPSGDSNVAPETRQAAETSAARKTPEAAKARQATKAAEGLTATRQPNNPAASLPPGPAGETGSSPASLPVTPVTETPPTSVAAKPSPAVEQSASSAPVATTQAVEDYRDRLRKQYREPKISVGFNGERGYFVEVPPNFTVPSDWVRFSVMKNGQTRYFTPELTALQATAESAPTAPQISAGLKSAIDDELKSGRTPADIMKTLKARAKLSGTAQETIEGVEAYLASKFTTGATAARAAADLPTVTGIDEQPWQIPRDEFVSGRPTEDAGFYSELAQGVSATGTPGISRENVDLSRIPSRFPAGTPATAIVSRDKNGQVQAIGVIATHEGQKHIVGVGRDLSRSSQRPGMQVIREVLKEGAAVPIDSLSADSAKLLHHASVKSAVDRGDSVPANVLSDYPSLAAKKPAKTAKPDIEAHFNELLAKNNGDMTKALEALQAENQAQPAAPVAATPAVSPEVRSENKPSLAERLKANSQKADHVPKVPVPAQRQGLAKKSPPGIGASAEAAGRDPQPATSQPRKGLAKTVSPGNDAERSRIADRVAELTPDDTRDEDNIRDTRDWHRTLLGAADDLAERVSHDGWTAENIASRKNLDAAFTELLAHLDGVVTAAPKETKHQADAAQAKIDTADAKLTGERDRRKLANTPESRAVLSQAIQDSPKDVHAEMENSVRGAAKNGGFFLSDDDVSAAATGAILRALEVSEDYDTGKPLLNWLNSFAVNAARQASADQSRSKETLTDTESLDLLPARKGLRKKPSLSDRASLAREDAKDALDDLGRALGDGTFATGVPLSPEVLRKFAVLTAKLVKAGALTFAAYTARLTEMLPAGWFLVLQPHMRATFDVALAAHQESQNAATVAAIAAAPVASATPTETPTETFGEQPVAIPEPATTPTAPVVPPATPTAPLPPASARPPHGPTSLKNAVVDSDRAERGRPPMTGEAPQQVEDWMARAAREISDGILVPSVLLDRLATDPFNLSALEIAGLTIERRRIVTAYNTLSDELFAARDAHNNARIVVAQQNLTTLDAELDRMEAATKAAGREWGRSGVARQIALNADYSRAGMERRARVANGGEAFTGTQADQVRDQIANWDRRYRSADRQAAYDEAHSEARTHAGTRTRSTRPPQPPAGIGANVDVNNQNSVANLAKRLQRMFVEAGMTDKTEVLNAVHAAIQEWVPGLSLADTMDAMSGYGKFTELPTGEVNEKIRKLNGLYQQLAKLRDMQAHQVPLKTGMEHREISDEERRLIQQVNEAKKQGQREGWYVVTDPVRQARSALDTAKKALLNRIYDLGEEIQSRTKTVANRTDAVTDAELLALRKLRDALKSQHDEIFGNKTLTDAQRIALAEKALGRSIADLTADLAHGKLYQDNTGKKSAWSPAIAAKHAQLEALRAQRQELRDIANPKLTDQEKSDAAYARSLAKQLADYTQRLADQDFAAKAKKPARVLTPGLVDAMEKRDAVKLEFLKQKHAWEKARQSWIMRRVGNVRDTLKAMRAMWTSWDASLIRRQGGALFNAHPILSAKAVPKYFASSPLAEKSLFATAKDEIRSQHEVDSNPNFTLYQKWGLELSDTQAKEASREEGFDSQFAHDYIPGVAGSERGGTAYLNAQRMAVMDFLVTSLGQGAKTTDADGALFANFVNVATGRGVLGKNFKSAASLLAEVFLAPRWVVSRLNLVAGYPLMKGLASPKGEKPSAKARVLIATEYARMAAGAAAYYGIIGAALFAMVGPPGPDKEWEIFTDSTGSNFGKIRIGNTYIDPLFGLSQMWVFLSKMTLGVSTKANGVVAPIRGPQVPYNGETALGDIGRFTQGKLAPVPQMGMEMFTGVDFMNRPITPLQSVWNHVVPLSMGQSVEIMKAQGVPAGVALSMMALIGEGASNYVAKRGLGDVAILASQKLSTENQTPAKSGEHEGLLKTEYESGARNDAVIKSAREVLMKRAPTYAEQESLLESAWREKHDGKLTPAFHRAKQMLPGN